MDTLAFLSKILPDEGLIVLAEFRNGAMKRHHFIPNVELASEKVLALDSTGAEVYHACATFKTDEGRKQANVAKVKSFFIDIDIGKADGYQTRNEAKDALTDMCKKVGLHAPLIVSSGSGLHCYWLFDAAVSGEVWKAGAQVFRKVLDSLNFKHDPSRTTDQASILRPVGSTWRKRGEKPVRMLVDASSQPFGWYLEKFNAFGVEAELPVAPISRKFIDIFPVAKLGGTSEYPPSSAIQIANQCAQLARMRDFQGAVSEPEWRNALGVIKHCTEGDALAHEWSKGDPRYDEEHTQEKLDRWETGPTTCEQFERTASHLCGSCKFKGKMTSPIQLGYTSAAEAPAEIVQPEHVAVSTIDYNSYWPTGFRWVQEDRALLCFTKNKDGVPEWLQFCDTLFYPITRIRLEDGSWAQRFLMVVAEGRKREFEIPTKALAKAETLRTYLASYEIIIDQRHGAHVVAYVTAWLAKYKTAGIETQTYKEYGWHSEDAAFLIGDNLISAKSETKVIIHEDLSGTARNLVGSGVAGTAEDWAETFNYIYNRPGAEAYQFTAMALLSAPLVHLIKDDSWHGIPIALTGPSGLGKSAVGKAACSAYGPLKNFMLEGANATPNAIDPFVGSMHHLPCILDEVTGRDPAVLSAKLYALASGGGRERAGINGRASNVKFLWDTVTLVTGNTNINEGLQQLTKAQSEASQVRVFEYVLEAGTLNRVFAGVDGPSLIEQNLGKQNYGITGRNAIREMMFHREKLVGDFYKVRNLLGRDSSSYDPKERFYVDLISNAYVGATVFRDLGYLKFNINESRDWAVEHIKSLREVRSENAYTSEDRLGQFLASLNGSILVTKHFDGRGVTESALDSFPLRSEIKARMAISSRHLLVTYKAFEEWCHAAKVPPAHLRKSLQDEGFIVPETVRAVITKGTNIPSAQQRVIEFVYDKVAGTETVRDAASKVVAIK